ncbi:MAG: GerMN domain-containing protein, partial [bacterium]
MLKKTNALFLLFSIVIIVFLLATVVKVRFFRSDSFSNSVREVISPDVGEKYIYSFQTSYEGNNKDITYELSIPKGKRVIFASSTNISEIIINDKNSTTTHKIRTFNNGGAGFITTTELWNNTELRTLCPDCQPTSTLAALGSMLKNGSIYRGTDKLFYLFPLSNNQLFLIVETNKQNPINKLLTDITIAVKISTSTTPINQSRNIKLFFVNTEFKPVINCDELVPVIRQLPASTQAIAAETMKLLVAGPTTEEINNGYTTSFPAGSAIKSISINTEGDAEIDFNSIVNTGGGSCHFRLL